MHLTTAPQADRKRKSLGVGPGFEKTSRKADPERFVGNPLNLALGGDHTEVPEIVRCGLTFVSMT